RSGLCSGAWTLGWDDTVLLGRLEELLVGHATGLDAGVVGDHRVDGVFEVGARRVAGPSDDPVAGNDDRARGLVRRVLAGDRGEGGRLGVNGQGVLELAGTDKLLVALQELVGRFLIGRVVVVRLLRVDLADRQKIADDRDVAGVGTLETVHRGHDR